MEWAYTIEVFRESGELFDTWRGIPIAYPLEKGSIVKYNNCEVTVLEVVERALGGDPLLGRPGRAKARLVHDFLEERLLDQIRLELVRVGADREPGLSDAIRVSGRGGGQVDLQDVRSRPVDFFWVGPGAIALSRLKGLPDDGGPQAVRSEFQDGQ